MERYAHRTDCAFVPRYFGYFFFRGPYNRRLIAVGGIPHDKLLQEQTCRASRMAGHYFYRKVLPTDLIPVFYFSCIDGLHLLPGEGFYRIVLVHNDHNFIIGLRCARTEQ